MADVASQLVNDDTTDIGYDLYTYEVTSPVTARGAYYRIDVGTGTTGTPMSATNPLHVSESIASPQSTLATQASLTSGSSATLNSDTINVSKTGHLLHCVVASSQLWKAELQTVSNGVASSNLAVWFRGDRLPRFQRGIFTVAYDAAAGDDNFRVVVTNLGHLTADVYAAFVWDEL